MFVKFIYLIGLEKPHISILSTRNVIYSFGGGGGGGGGLL